MARDGTYSTRWGFTVLASLGEDCSCRCGCGVEALVPCLLLAGILALMLFAALLLWAPRNQNLPSQRTGGDPSGGDSRPTTLEETLLFPRQSTPVPASASGTRGSSEPHPTQLSSSQSGSAFPGLNTPETTMQDTCPVHGPPALHPFEFWL